MINISSVVTLEKDVMPIGKLIKDIESSIESMASIETGVLEKNINWFGIKS